MEPFLQLNLSGHYNKELKLLEWPENLLQSTLQAYAKAKQLEKYAGICFSKLSLF